MHRRDLPKLGASFATIPTGWRQEAAQQAAKPNWRPSILSAHENETRIAITRFIHATDTQVATLMALDEGTGAGHRLFLQGKSLTSKIYYATEIGQQELNRGGRVPASFGCAHGTHA